MKRYLVVSLAALLWLVSDVPAFSQSNGTGIGLKADHYSDSNLSSFSYSSTDSRIDFDWGDPADENFSIRWTGQIQPRYSQTYTFDLNADDGARLWVNGQLLIDYWPGGTGVNQTIALVAGTRYDIKVEYCQFSGAASVHLGWSSPSQSWEIVPSSQLYPGPPAPPWITSQPTSQWPISPTPLPVSAVAAGGTFSMALKNDGTVWTWGENSNGQLGDGTYSARGTAMMVPSLTGITVVAAGGYHALALKSDGTVWAWGYNAYGQVGDGTTTNRLSPVQVSGLSGIVAVVAGDYHSFALKNDGTLWGWGNNNDSELGDGTIGIRSTPVRITGISNVTAIAAGSYFSFAVKSDGTVWGWGTNLRWALGNITSYGARQMTPAQLPGISGATRVACGARHGLVLASDGTVWTWGAGDYGVQGDGTFNDYSTPIQVPGLSSVVAIAARDYHSHVVTSDGHAWSWGADNNGQLGDGTYNYSGRPSPTQVVGVTSAARIAAGTSHLLIGTSDGDVWCTGSNSAGQLGTGFTTGTITTPIHPLSRATFTLAAGSQSWDPAPTYQWQRKPSGQSSFVNLANDSTYRNVTTASLTIYGPTASMDGDQFRCVVSNPTGSVTSNPAVLIFAPPTVRIVSGTGQTASVSQFNAQPFVASVYNNAGTAPMPGIQLAFAVQSGGGRLATTNVGSPTLYTTLSALTDANGQARVYYKQPYLGGLIGQITAGVGGAQVTFTTQSVGPDPLVSMTTFTNLGVAMQSYTVPGNASYVIIQAWGGGGGGCPAIPNESWSLAGCGGTGGSGGFVNARYNVAPGDDFTVMVGTGGTGYRKYSSFNGGIGGWPGGGNGGSGGGGYTRVQTPYGEIWAGGGGGGGSIGNGGDAAGSLGGASGTVLGSEIHDDPNTPQAGGGGGTLTTGGGSAYPGYGGSAGQGGYGMNYAGGGGGGLYGGGGGSGCYDENTSSAYYGGYVSCGGGAGSSTVTGSASNVTINFGAVALISEPAYPGSSVAIGGINGGSGGDGAVVILAYAGPIPAPTITSSTNVTALQNQSVSYTIIASPAVTSYSATGLPAGLTFNAATAQITGRVATAGTYTSTISATNRTGTTQATLTWTIAADTSAPSVPSGLQASNVSLGSCQLTWSASTDNVATTVYEVKRDSTSLGVTPQPTFSVTGLAPGTTYLLSVRAGDAAGNWSAWSAPVMVTVSSDTIAPLAATSVTAVGTSATNVTLVWSPGSDNVSVASYTVFRDGQQIGTTSELVFVDTGLSPGGSHTYTVTASDGAGNQSVASNTLTAATNASYTGDADHDGIPDAIEALIFPSGHGAVTIDQANILQTKIHHPIR